VGPTSHPSHHHIRSASRGVSHTWMAAIVTGVAVVLTGALALQGVQADGGESISERQLAEEVRRLSNRVEDMETALWNYTDACIPESGAR